MMNFGDDLAMTNGMKKIKMLTLASGLAFLYGPLAQAADSMSDMDHSKMGHDMTLATQTDMNEMDHSSSHQSMQGVTAPADARDPHAYSGGFSVGHMATHGMADQAYFGGLLLDRLETVQSRDNTFNAYELQSWCGKDYNKFVIKAEGEVDEGKLHEAHTELLWGRAITPHWDTQIGLRYDSGLAPDRTWLAFGVQGLAPYWFEVDATAYVGEHGRSALRLGAEYEMLLTQKLILQPRIEATLYGKNDAVRELGSGLSSLAAGLRLRYEIRREFAPYLGVEWNGKFGGTADYARAAGERSSETRIIAGVRFWY